MSKTFHSLDTICCRSTEKKQPVIPQTTILFFFFYILMRLQNNLHCCQIFFKTLLTLQLYIFCVDHIPSLLLKTYDKQLCASVSLFYGVVFFVFGR